MDHLPPASLVFLADLAKNNHKEWFHANKKRYEAELKKPARAFVATLNERLGEVAPELVQDKPEKTLSRINRDIRFSKDKSPYNTHIWAGFGDTTRPKGQSAGFYVGVSPDSYGVGGGTWKIEKDRIVSMRAYIAEHHRALADIVSAPAFASSYGELRGDAYKRVPKPFPADHPAAEWLKLKSIHVRTEGDVSLATQPGFVDRLVGHAADLMPLIRFLREGLGD